VVWLFLALLLLTAWLRAISSTLHLGMALGVHFLLLMLPAHLLLMMLRIHLLLVMLHLLIHRMLPVSRTSGSAHVAGVHLGLVSAHVPLVALISRLMLVSVSSALSCATVTCSRALPIILFSNLFATVSRFACSGFPSASVEITFVYVPIFVSSSRSLALALA
jgi:hypothetical protein